MSASGKRGRFSDYPVAAGFCLALAVLGIIGYVEQRALLQLSRAGEEVRRTESATRSMEQAVFDIRRLGSAARVFAESGEELQSFDTLLARARAQVLDLRKQEVPGGGLSGLADLADQSLSAAQRLVEARRSGIRPGLAALLASGADLDILRRLEDSRFRLVTGELSRRQRNPNAAETAIRGLLPLTEWGTLFAFAVILITWWLLYSGLRRQRRSDASLIAAHEFTEAVLDNLHDGVVACDANRTLTRMNRAARGIYGIGEGGAVGQSPEVHNLFHSDGRAPLSSREMPLYRALAGEHVNDLELRVVPAGSKPRTILASGRSITSPDGVLLGAMLTMHDITDARETEELVRSRDILYRSMFSAMAEGVVVQEGAGEITAFNQSALRILGLTESQLLGRTSTDLEHRCIRDDESPFPGLEHPAMVVLRTGEPQSNIRMGICREDGTRSWILINSQPFQAGESNSPRPAAVTTFTDITRLVEVEEDLRRSRQVLREAQRIARLGNWHIDARKWTIEWSEEMYALYAWDSSMPPPSTDEARNAVYTPASLDRFIALRNALITDQQSFEIDLELLPRPGAARFVTITGEAERDSAGNLIALNGTVQDITERKTIEQTLRMYAEELDDLYNHTPCGYHSLDANGIFLRINDTELRMIGYERDEIVGKRSLADLLVEADRPRFRENLSLSLQTGSLDGIEYDLVRKDGSILSVLVSVSIHLDSDGRFVRTRASLIDITERRRAEQARLRVEETLRVSEQRYRRFVERSPAGVLRTTPLGEILDCNAAFALMLGFTSPDERIGRNMVTFSPDTDERAMVAQSLEEHRIAVNFESPLLRQGGEPLWTSATVAIVEDDPDGPVLEGIVIDISDRRRMEEALRLSLQEKEVLLRELHHRVKNNLQIVASLLHMQAGLTEVPAAKALFRESENRVHSMAAVHESLYRTPDFTRVNLAAYLRRVVAAVASSYGRGDVQCSVVGGDDESMPMGAAMPCGLIVNELVSNALKHAFPARSGVVAVTLSRVGSMLLVVIEDNGRGLPEAVGLGSSSGLGLQLVENLVRQLKGKCRFVRGIGTRFELEFSVA